MPRYEVPVFRAERDCGLEGQIRAAAGVAFACRAELDPAPKKVALSRRALAGLGNRVKATNEGQPDLHYLKTLLVSTVWNHNDDVFDPLETWASRHTPEDKRFNFEHIDDDIIGHITANFVVNDAREPVPDDTPADELPSPFHIITPAVLYRDWEDDALQERMDRVIAEIPEGKWFVSMEAAFRHFDYGIRRPDGTYKVVARGEKTAFLTKHLRAYGGDGVYQDCRVGRVLRNIVFTGKGLVRRPANDASVIFAGTEAFDAKAAEILRSVEELGYGTPTRNGAKQLVERTMAAEVTNAANFEAENKALRETVDRLQARLAQADEQKAKASEDAVKTRDQRIATLESQVAAAEEKAKASADTAAALKAKLEETEKAHRALAEQVEKDRAKAKHDGRVAALKASLELDDKKAEETAARLAGLSDEDFESHAKFLAEKHAEAKAIKGGSGKQTPAKDPPKQTNKPAPGGGYAPKVKTLAAEHDGADADPADLADAEPVKDAALAAGGEDRGVSKVRASIKSYMGDFFKLPEGDEEESAEDEE